MTFYFGKYHFFFFGLSLCFLFLFLFFLIWYNKVREGGNQNIASQWLTGIALIELDPLSKMAIHFSKKKQKDMPFIFSIFSSFILSVLLLHSTKNIPLWKDMPSKIHHEIFENWLSATLLLHPLRFLKRARPFGRKIIRKRLREESVVKKGRGKVRVTIFIWVKLCFIVSMVFFVHKLF